MVRHVSQIVLAVVLWSVFGYYWSLVVQNPPTPQMKVALITLGVLCTFIMLFLVGWIIHNIRIYRDQARRRMRCEGPEPPVKDAAGGWVVAEHPEGLRTANYMEAEGEKNMVDGKINEKKSHLSGKQV